MIKFLSNGAVDTCAEELRARRIESFEARPFPLCRDMTAPAGFQRPNAPGPRSEGLLGWKAVHLEAMLGGSDDCDQHPSGVGGSVKK